MNLAKKRLKKIVDITICMYSALSSVWIWKIHLMQCHVLHSIIHNACMKVTFLKDQNLTGWLKSQLSAAILGLSLEKVVSKAWRLMLLMFMPCTNIFEKDLPVLCWILTRSVLSILLCYNKGTDLQEGWSVNSAGILDETTGICEVLMYSSEVSWQTNTENEKVLKGSTRKLLGCQEKTGCLLQTAFCHLGKHCRPKSHPRRKWPGNITEWFNGHLMSLCVLEWSDG